MRRITRKSEVGILLQDCLNKYPSSGLTALCSSIDQQLLSNKVKFPLLEFCGHTLYEFLPEKEHIPFCDQIEDLKQEGGNVILGIILQRRLAGHYEETIQQTAHYISKAHIWYICDIIGERVWGVALLQFPLQTTAAIKDLMEHPSKWVVRSLGAGIHYAIKKGLEKEYIAPLFQLLLSKAMSHDKEIRQGIGWAAKTTARFHPEIIRFRESELHNEQKVSAWFRTKIRIGLERNTYAKNS